MPLGSQYIPTNRAMAPGIHTRSDVTQNDVLIVSKDNEDRNLMFPYFKTFSSLEFSLSAVVA